MALRNVLPLLAAGALALPAAALADHSHVVSAGESLTSIAAAAGIPEATLAAANHLPIDARLLIGATLRIPRSSAGHRTAPAAPRVVTTDYHVRPGDTLTAIAARFGISLGVLARLNHIAVNGSLLAGATLRVPARASAPASVPTRSYRVRPGDTLSAIAARAGISLPSLAALNQIRVNALLLAGSTLKVPASSASPSTATTTRAPQHYVVQPGDTLSAIAARAGVGLDRLAAFDGLAVSGILISGVTLTLPAGARPVGPPLSSNLPPYPTPELVSAAEIEQIAAANGVPASLAAAIGWQESGFNNNLVSSADARGVMQILPKTWSWIERSLDTGTPLAPASALDNVRGGVLLLRSLLIATHGNLALTAAGYVQGLASVRKDGMFAVTRQYVKDVLALRHMFGG